MTYCLAAVLSQHCYSADQQRSRTEADVTSSGLASWEQQRNLLYNALVGYECDHGQWPPAIITNGQYCFRREMTTVPIGNAGDTICEPVEYLKRSTLCNTLRDPFLPTRELTYFTLGDTSSTSRGWLLSSVGPDGICDIDSAL